MSPDANDAAEASGTREVSGPLAGRLVCAIALSLSLVPAVALFQSRLLGVGV